VAIARCFIGIGSNMVSQRCGDRLNALEQAAKLIASHPATRRLKTSPIFENPALVPDGAPDLWRTPFLNAVVELQWQSSPQELLEFLKKTEVDLGRTPGPRWSPRVIDLDLLVFADEVLESKTLKIPHPELNSRAFVLAPLKHLAPTLPLPLASRTSVLHLARRLKEHLPLWMGIVNITPDSFSDGGSVARAEDLESRLELFDKNYISCIDLGAESTRPSAPTLSPAEEWHRLEPALSLLCNRYQQKYFKPKISIDTYHAATATRALEFGCDIINDVSGLSDPKMINVIQNSECDYVLMHSLTIPANPAITMRGEDLILELKLWAEQKIGQLKNGGVHLDRIVFDPGIGFGKTPAQSREILRRVTELFDLPVRILIGHSRKSFLVHGNASPRPASDRDPETLAISLSLAESGVDILRVHAADLHHRSFRALQEIK
jgi:2-amino-4-hydroxy-6-hydroxymethyldihydropteridine diphosphokinase/dihydropteroate synthase